MSLAVNRLTNANIYVDGNSFLGRAEEITLPTVTSKMSEHKALGMVGMFELFSGIDKLEGRIKWNSFYSDVFKKISNPTKSVEMQIRASLETHGSAGKSGEVACVVYMTGQFKSVPLGNFKQNENVELESTINVTYVKLVIAGATIMELDVMANIYEVDGVDLLATYRANLGI